MSLSAWERNGWVTRHETSANEIRDLLQVVERDLADSAAPGLSADWRMNIAYNAALQASTIALAASGYRPGRDAHHFRVIQSLRETMGTDAGAVATLDAFRKKRNITGYCHHRPQWDPLPPISPRSSDPLGGLETVLRLGRHHA